MLLRIWSLLTIFMVVSSGSTAADSLQFAIVVDGEVLVSDSDIEEYNWNTHRISFSEKAKNRIESQWAMSLGHHKNWPSFFSVKVNGEVIYKGRFQSAISSYLPEGPLIGWPFGGARHFHIGFSRGPVDPRSDNRVKVALKNLGVLEE